MSPRLKFLLFTVWMLCVQTVSFATALPVSLKIEPQQRDDYDWFARHAEVLALHAQVKPDLVFIGDSITHQWGGNPKSHRIIGAASWDALFAGRVVTNLGFGFDYADNAYYRVLQGELDGISPRLILINIGTNNLGFRGDSPTACAANVAALVALVKEKQPHAKVLLIGIYPRREPHLKDKILQTNQLLRIEAERLQVAYADVGQVLLGADGLAHPDYFRDTVHPNAAGYERLAEALRPLLDK